jgi:hypothetical protein
MSSLHPRVEDGRLVLDEADELTGEEGRTLQEARSASWKSAEAKRLRPASAILDELQQGR